jgi:RNA polymerase sigma-70 factor (ECF subfamily)
MEQQELIPHLFRTEYQKITAVLCKLFGFEHIEVAEDIASDTFLSATELWGLKGLPENPVAWLYTVAKNKAKNVLKRQSLFDKKIAGHLKVSTDKNEIPELDLSEKNIQDSQLQMMFAICHPAVAPEAQIGFALRILCGFGIDEIADAFLTNKETINKRLFRAKEKLREEKIEIRFPGKQEMTDRLDMVLRTLYLLFNEGYYSASNNAVLRKDLCFEAMRLTYLLLENEETITPSVCALLSLMCFHASRFEARTGDNGEIILYDEQDTGLWDNELIVKGEYLLNKASEGTKVSKYHLEAGIAYWHTKKEDTNEKWESILQLYNHLLQIEYSPVAALNRTYALSKANSRKEAIIEAEKLDLTTNHFYYTLLGELYRGIDDKKAKNNFERALVLAKTAADRQIIKKKLSGF